MKGGLVASWLVLVMLTLSSLAYAHHGWSSYDEDRTVAVSGTVEVVHFEHPHATVRLRAEDSVWLVVLPPPTRAIAMGLSADLLRPGTRVVAVGHPHRREPREMRALTLSVGDRTFRLR